KNFTFRDSLEIEKMADHYAISLLWQGEADYIWAVELTRWSEPDPPVVAYYLDHDQWPERFELHGPWAPTVSSYALDYLFTYISSNGGGFSTRESQPAFNRDVLVAELGAPTRFGHLELFAKDGVVAVRKELPEEEQHRRQVQMRQPTSRTALPLCLQRLYREAHIKRQLPWHNT